MKISSTIPQARALTTIFLQPWETCKTYAQAGGNIKLFEAVFESMPQLYIQSIVLLGGVLKEDNTVVYVSLALSVASTAQASARAVPF